MQVMDPLTLIGMRTRVEERLKPDTQQVVTDRKPLYKRVIPKANTKLAYTKKN
jgi:hypothetical protein